MEQETIPASVVSVPRARRVSFDVASMWAILGTVVLASIIFIPAASIPFVFTKVSVLAIGALVALALYILARLSRGNAIVPPLPLLGALWIVPFAYLLSALFSGVGIHTGFFGTDLETDTLGFVLVLAALATLTALIFRRPGSFRTFFSVGGAMLGFVVVVQTLIFVGSRIAPTKLAATTNIVGTFTDVGMLQGLGITIPL